MSITDKDIEKANTLLMDADSLKKFAKDGFRVAIRNNPNIDKYNCGFNLDYRFSESSTKISLDSWVGYYGNSGCQTYLKIYNENEFSTALVEWLNKNRDSVFNGIADILIERAKKMRDKIDEVAKLASNTVAKLDGMIGETVDNDNGVK